MLVHFAGPADPFSVSGDPYALTGGQGGAELRPSGDTDEWFRRLCATSNGVLYEDSCLQVCTCILIVCTTTKSQKINWF